MITGSQFLNTCKPCILISGVNMRMESGALISANVKLREQLDKAKEALQFYADGKHYDTPGGKTRLLDNGGTAEDCLQELE